MKYGLFVSKGTLWLYNNYSNCRTQDIRVISNEVFIVFILCEIHDLGKKQDFENHDDVSFLRKLYRISL